MKKRHDICNKIRCEHIGKDKLCKFNDCILSTLEIKEKEQIQEKKMTNRIIMYAVAFSIALIFYFIIKILSLGGV